MIYIFFLLRLLFTILIIVVMTIMVY